MCGAGGGWGVRGHALGVIGAGVERVTGPQSTGVGGYLLCVGGFEGLGWRRGAPRGGSEVMPFRSWGADLGGSRDTISRGGMRPRAPWPQAAEGQGFGVNSTRGFELSPHPQG